MNTFTVCSRGERFSFTGQVDMDKDNKLWVLLSGEVVAVFNAWDWWAETCERSEVGDDLGGSHKRRS